MRGHIIRGRNSNLAVLFLLFICLLAFVMFSYTNRLLLFSHYVSHTDAYSENCDYF